MNHAYILIGGNLGNREENLKQARALISRDLGKIIQISAVYETEPWGSSDQPMFLNQVLCIETAMLPWQLMKGLLETETALGRQRREKFGPRTIDLDILFYADWIVSIPGLQIPHPRLQDRRFVLEPMTALAPLFRHPSLNSTMQTLLEQCKDGLAVHKSTAAVHNNA